MRKINTRNFRLATRQTQREVNRRIVLNLIREYQPISRAELARRMNVRRGAVTLLVRELLESGVVQEVGPAAVVRGRRPTMLSVRTSGSLIAAADVRPIKTFLALADVGGRIVARDAIDTPESPERLPALLAEGVQRLLEQHGSGGMVNSCIALGLVVPGMIDRKTGKLIYAPRLGWRDVDLRNEVSEQLGLRVYIESAPIACAMARLWLSPDETRGVNSFAYVHISDGVGVGLVLNGEAVRGETHSAGEFGHVTLDWNGPDCVCGRRGCWEALTCNSTTIARYVAGATGERRTMNGKNARSPALTIGEVVRRAKRGERAAVDAIVEAGRDIGRGLALVVGAFNPGRIYVGGEITAAWELLEEPVRRALAEGAITKEARATPVFPDGSPAEYRLQGAVALVTAPTFAAHAVG
ncbi:MAG TPA: ROK family transcriptional regulator [Gemmatimonadaceae bacterium]|nr:ROK family transcriptional regulator [Gemmatimonadaceae bacterium]